MTQEMNKSLDDKLKKLVMRHGWITEDDNWQQAVADIKQAFEDEGYVKLDIKDKDKLDKGVWTQVMSGPVWYERFEKEADSCMHYIRSLFREGYPSASEVDEREMFVKQDILEAAKKAAGIE